MNFPAVILAFATFLFCQNIRGADSPTSVSLPAGTIRLHASNATVHGVTLRYEPQTNKNCLGFWTEPGDWASWKFDVRKSGNYQVEVWQGCGKGQGGSDVKVQVGEKSFSFVVEETGHFQNFQPRKVGLVRLKKGTHTLAIKPQNKKAKAIMDIQQILLIPDKRSQGGK